MNPRLDLDTAGLNASPAETAGEPPVTSRATLHRRFERLQDPSEALKILHSYVPSCPARVQAVCTPQKYYRRDDGREDRFIVRVDTVTTAGRREAFVFKGYADDRGQQIMHAFHAMTPCPECPPDTCPVSRPLAYVPHERLLISRWVHGQTLWARIQCGDSGVLARIPAVLTHLYRAAVRPEAATTAQTLLDEALSRCATVCQRWPAAAATVHPVMAALQEALPLLAPTPPALVHGDLKPEHCLWNGRHVSLIDLDSFCYTDPAYDAGRLLARLHRQCLPHPALLPRVRQLLAPFRSAFLSAVPTVSARNIAFYYALQFAREICRDLCSVPVREDWPRVIASYAHYAMSALQTDIWPDGQQRSSTPRGARTRAARAAS